MNRQSWNFGNHWDSLFLGPAAPTGCKSQIKSPLNSLMTLHSLTMREHLPHRFLHTKWQQQVNAHFH